ncbi:MAG: hypothetical protein LBT50_09195, partial [Prevotellaceae bacterium]|nr:hypothetical protein [Prevotellaceae bacterium]
VGWLLLIYFTIKRIPRHAQPPRPSGTPPKEGNLEDVKVILSATSFSLLAPLAERLLEMTDRLGFRSASK